MKHFKQLLRGNPDLTREEYNSMYQEEVRKKLFIRFCEICGKEIPEGDTEHGCYCTPCWEKKIDALTPTQFLRALKVKLSYIQKGAVLVADDSEETGNKYTECSWGMCKVSEELYPDPMEHRWPLSYKRYHRVAPLDWPKGYSCPMDSGMDLHWKSHKLEERRNTGCFHRCRVFMSLNGWGNPTSRTPNRDQAIRFYLNEIARIEQNEVANLDQTKKVSPEEARILKELGF